MAADAGMTAVDHIGFSVASIDEAVRFWTEAMGFALVRRGEMGGEFLQAVTGVEDPRCRVALLVAPGGFSVELLEYSTGPKLGRAPGSAGAIGAAHLAVTVADIHTAIDRIKAAGWRINGSAQAIPAGPRAGTIVAYITGPDGITIELMQPQVQAKPCRP
jgi:catechol 2,3-dioxygenase-like lactoylglutathione lyase family enzyme